MNFERVRRSVGARSGSQHPRVTVCHAPGAKGWSGWSGGGAAREWSLRIAPDGKDFSVRSRQFAIAIEGPPGLPMLVEQSGDLLNPIWTTTTTLTLVETGVGQFIDNNPARGRARYFRFTAQ